MEKALDLFLRQPPRIEREDGLFVLVTCVGETIVRCHIKPRQAARLGRNLLIEFEGFIAEQTNIVPIRTLHRDRED